MPVGVLIFQGMIISFLSIVFLLMPNVNSSFWILLVLASELYLVMYILMFVSGIILRYKKPKTFRAYKIPGKNLGMWLIAGSGIIGAVFAMAMGFFPPNQLETGNLLFFELVLIGGMILFCAMPFIILLLKKPSWNKSNSL